MVTLLARSLYSLRITKKNMKLIKSLPCAQLREDRESFLFDGKVIVPLKIVGSLRAIWEIARHY
jgi:hypothetical protein